MARSMTAEHRRLVEDAAREKNWKRWGPYLAERQWATVREDYSPDGSSWRYFPHEHARSRAYRWGEDGLLGFTDRQCRLCFAPALWNGRDPILKERLFGLTGPEGNHGEDVKEHYYYLEATPTHSYLKARYHYPQAEFPYQLLLAENRNRGLNDPEFELADSGVFSENRFFSVVVEYAKVDTDDLLIRLTVKNHGPEPAPLHLLSTIWFRNTWSWGCASEGCHMKPLIRRREDNCLAITHETLGDYRLWFGPGPDGSPPPVLFTENETNRQRLYGAVNETGWVKDGFHDYIVDGRFAAINSEQYGTKVALHYVLQLQPGAEQQVRLQLSEAASQPSGLRADGFDSIMGERIEETKAFYDRLLPASSDETRLVARRAYAGLLWSKQFYNYIVKEWLEGDPNLPPPPENRWRLRNTDWTHLYSRDILSVPDKWEYPWFASWDLAFHMLPFAKIDPYFAKEQLVLLLREWYLHPNGQMPAYEFSFDDVNPPVHAWAVWRVNYAPGESDSGLFGGNSNWRGPIWLPVNYLLIEALERYHHHYGDQLKVELPTGSGQWCNLQQVADELSNRLVRLFLPDQDGRRPYLGNAAGPGEDNDCRDLILFHEYFNGDTGQGLGADHQTGWTALVARCIESLHKNLERRPETAGDEKE